MQSPFLRASIRAIESHGVAVVWSSIQSSAYDPATGLNSLSRLDSTFKSYPKHEQANQFKYPLLIGKDIVLFYVLARDCTPKMNDIVTYKGKKYTVQNVQEFMARGEVILYKVLAVCS